MLRLNNGLTVRLIGLSERPSHRAQAIEYLETKAKGQRVYLRFDKDKHDEAGNLLAYVYLKNKTFLNAHLARTGFVSIDTAVFM